jgi:hypothetical protein
MDPLGLALENFDGLGQWRDKEPGGAIDPKGQLADGTPIDGPVALRNALLERRDMFVRTLTEKLMTYGLGRGVELADRPLVRDVARQAAARDYRWSAIVLGIVRSAPFQNKKAAVPEPQQAAAVPIKTVPAETVPVVHKDSGLSTRLEE